VICFAAACIASSTAPRARSSSISVAGRVVFRVVSLSEGRRWRCVLRQSWAIGGDADSGEGGEEGEDGEEPPSPGAREPDVMRVRFLRVRR
jgi:hypothetical protein